MPARVVTIARTIGSQGEETGLLVADALGFECVDDEIITRAAEITGLDPEQLSREEEPRPLLTRVLDALAPLAQRRGGGVNLSGTIVEVETADTPTTPQQADPGAYASYEALIRSVIDEVAQRGDAVIVAHGAGLRLAGRGDVLRVLVTASRPVRVRRLEEQGAASGDAVRAVDESDRARREFLHRFYHAEREVPTHYDLVVSTDHISPSQAAHVIVEAARA